MGRGSRDGQGQEVWGEPQGPKVARRKTVQGKMQEMTSTGTGRKTHNRENTETGHVRKSSSRWARGQPQRVEKQQHTGQGDGAGETVDSEERRDREGGGEGRAGEGRREE